MGRLGERGEEGRGYLKLFLLLPLPKQGCCHGYRMPEFYHPKRHVLGSEQQPAGTGLDVTVPPARSRFANPFLSKGCDVVPWEVSRALSPQTASVGCSCLWEPCSPEWVTSASEGEGVRLWAEEENG